MTLGDLFEGASALKLSVPDNTKDPSGWGGYSCVPPSPSASPLRDAIGENIAVVARDEFVKGWMRNAPIVEPMSDSDSDSDSDSEVVAAAASSEASDSAESADSAESVASDSAMDHCEAVMSDGEAAATPADGVGVMDADDVLDHLMEIKHAMTLSQFKNWFAEPPTPTDSAKLLVLIDDRIPTTCEANFFALVHALTLLVVAACCNSDTTAVDCVYSALNESGIMDKMKKAHRAYGKRLRSNVCVARQQCVVVRTWLEGLVRFKRERAGTEMTFANLSNFLLTGDPWKPARVIKALYQRQLTVVQLAHKAGLIDAIPEHVLNVPAPTCGRKRKAPPPAAADAEDAVAPPPKRACKTPRLAERVWTAAEIFKTKSKACMAKIAEAFPPSVMSMMTAAARPLRTPTNSPKSVFKIGPKLMVEGDPEGEELTFSSPTLAPRKQRQADQFMYPINMLANNMLYFQFNSMVGNKAKANVGSLLDAAQTCAATKFGWTHMKAEDKARMEECVAQHAPKLKEKLPFYQRHQYMTAVSFLAIEGTVGRFVKSRSNLDRLIMWVKVKACDLMRLRVYWEGRKKWVQEELYANIHGDFRVSRNAILTFGAMEVMRSQGCLGECQCVYCRNRSADCSDCALPAQCDTCAARRCSACKLTGCHHAAATRDRGQELTRLLPEVTRVVERALSRLIQALLFTNKDALTVCGDVAKLAVVRGDTLSTQFAPMFMAAMDKLLAQYHTNYRTGQLDALVVSKANTAFAFTPRQMRDRTLFELTARILKPEDLGSFLFKSSQVQQTLPDTSPFWVANSLDHLFVPHVEKNVCQFVNAVIMIAWRQALGTGGPSGPFERFVEDVKTSGVFDSLTAVDAATVLYNNRT